MDKILAAQPLKVPVMLVHSLWDQEDIYGALAVYKAIEPKDTGNDKVFLVMGPWYHGQKIRDGSALGAMQFDSDTALTFRREILRPFLDQYLKDGAPKADVPPVTAFETGTNAWRRLHVLALGLRHRLHVAPTPLYLAAGLKLSFDAPQRGESAPSTSTSPIPPSRCRSARAPSSRSATADGTLARSGSSTTSARRRGVPTCSPSSPTS